MSYKDVLDIILPPVEGRTAHITGHYGEVRAKGPHGGSDFNYTGGQAGINLTHPKVHSPISGEVIFVGGQFGTVTIRDADGNEHKLLHMDTQTVAVHQVVRAGEQIGTMGGRGPGDRNRYAQHVHYQMKDRAGHALNPEVFWQHRAVAASLPPRSSGMDAPVRGGGSSSSLHDGSHGEQVRSLQDTLATLGYRNPDGTPFVADGRFGSHTRAAVEAFQREHGLRADGVVGERTQRLLAATQANPLADRSHPQHGLYSQALRQVHAEETHRQLPHGRHSEHLAAALAVAAGNAGVARIDRIEINPAGTQARAVQVSALRDEPGLNRTTLPVDIHRALATPLHAHEARSAMAPGPSTRQHNPEVLRPENGATHGRTISR